MSRTETKTLKETVKSKECSQLDLAKLKSVQWIASSELVSMGYNFSSVKYKAAKETIPFMSMYLAVVEMIFLGMYTFINNLPYPVFFQNIVHKVDGVGVSVMDNLTGRLEWWLDIIIIRWMWFRDSIEPIFEGAFSFVVNSISTVIGFWMWVASLYIRAIGFFVSPILRQIDNILFPSQQKTLVESSGSAIEEKRDEEGPNESQIPHIYCCNYGDSNQLQSESTSECDSEISAVSESWIMGHTDKYGKSYNRVEMRATAEGRLRAAMYKRIKGQIKIMRQNSWSLSKGMTDYIRHFLQPKVFPVYSTLKAWFDEVADKYGLLDVFEAAENWRERHYVICAPINAGLFFAKIPVDILSKLLTPKKKSRKTRSVRSESLRRRVENASGVPMDGSKELDSPEEVDYLALDKIRKSLLKRGTERMDDSALASSIDDLCVISDTDGAVSVKERVAKFSQTLKQPKKVTDSNTDPVKKSLDHSKEYKYAKSDSNESLDMHESDKQPSEMSLDLNSGNGSIKEESDITSTDSSTETDDSISISRQALEKEIEEALNPKSPSENVSPTSSLKSKRRAPRNAEDAAQKQQRRISFSLT